MKKNLLVSMAMAVMAWLLLPACGTDSEKNPALQAPVTTQTETTAENAKTAPAASPADTSAQRENPSEKAETGKDKDDDDDK